jgi:hypothetical protein
MFKGSILRNKDKKSWYFYCNKNKCAIYVSIHLWGGYCVKVKCTFYDIVREQITSTTGGCIRLKQQWWLEWRMISNLRKKWSTLWQFSLGADLTLKLDHGVPL